MRYNSLMGKILLWIMPIVIVGLLSLSFAAYKYINIVIEDELSNSMLVSVSKSAESINRWLATIMLEPETIASTPAAKRINDDFNAFDTQNINRHKILHEKHPDIFQDIYAANSKGEYHTIIQNDSIMITGDKLLQTFDYLEVAEFSAKSLIMGTSLGKMTPINDNQVEDLRKIFLAP